MTDIKQQKTTTISKTKNSQGKDEAWCEWFECPNCGDDFITDTTKYCPNCGKKLKWIK